MQWSKQKKAGFSTNKSWLPVNENYLDINVESENADENAVINYYSKLINLRSEYEELISGNFKELLADDEKLFAFVREMNGHKLIIVVNFSLDDVLLPAEFVGKKILIYSYLKHRLYLDFMVKIIFV